MSEARDALVDTAQRRTVITYGELREKISNEKFPESGDGNNFGQAMAQLMDAINKIENERIGRPTMLTSVVVRADTWRPGDGFQRLLDAHGWPGSWAEWLTKTWKQYR